MESTSAATTSNFVVTDSEDLSQLVFAPSATSGFGSPLKTNSVASNLTTNLLTGLLMLVSLVARLFTMPAFVESRDGLFFVRGLEHYAVTEMRPHWPGYPVYLWFAKLCQLVLQSDPTQAFHVLSVLASCLTIWPIVALTQDWRKELGGNAKEAMLAGLGAGLMWAVMPLSWLGGSEIFSDPLGLLLALLMLWLCWRSLKLKQLAGSTELGAWLIVGAAVIAGLTLGTRLSYLALLLPLAYTSWIYRKEKIKIGPILLNLWLIVGAGLVLSVGLWLGWQFLMEGPRFIDAGLQHLTGHYTSWGGSVTSDHNVATRPLRFLETLIVYGVGGWWPNTSWLRLGVSLGLAILLAIGIWHLSNAASRVPSLLLGLWALPYSLWILLGNDVDLARYGTPLLALICIVAGLGLPRVGPEVGKIKSLSAIALTGLVVLLIALVTIPLAFEHQSNPPIGQKLVSYVNTHLDTRTTSVIVGDDVSPLIFFLIYDAPTYQNLRVNSDKLEAQAEALEAQGRTVYLVTTAPPAINWTEVTSLERGQFMESRGPLQVQLYRHSTVVSK